MGVEQRRANFDQLHCARLKQAIFHQSPPYASDPRVVAIDC
jgi:hypothetical protein